MFNMGGGELIVVALVALLLIPPNKLPQVATNLGRFFVQLQRGFNEMKSGFEKSVKEASLEIKRPPVRTTPLNPPVVKAPTTPSEEKPSEPSST